MVLVFQQDAFRIFMEIIQENNNNNTNQQLPSVNFNSILAPPAGPNLTLYKWLHTIFWASFVSVG